MEDNLPEVHSESVCYMVMGMAGSGKTTFVTQLLQQLQSRQRRSLAVNLDPAVREVGYSIDYDIKKQVDYKKVMQTHKLGPNGAILTSLNLFAASHLNSLADSVQAQAKDSPLDIVVDTPGQLEVFTWSASGQIICEVLSKPPCGIPTILVYVVDSIKCQQPNSFMSNMLFALSVQFKMKLPLLVVLNKADICDTTLLKSWFTDYEAYQEALTTQNNYLSSLSRSMSLGLDQFYQDLSVVSLSSLTGQGFKEFFQAMPSLKEEYHQEFLGELKQKQEQKQEGESVEMARFEAEFKRQSLE